MNGPTMRRRAEGSTRLTRKPSTRSRTRVTTIVSNAGGKGSDCFRVVSESISLHAAGAKRLRLCRQEAHNLPVREHNVRLALDSVEVSPAEPDARLRGLE